LQVASSRCINHTHRTSPALRASIEGIIAFSNLLFIIE